jgi:acetyl esterase/lipase
MGHRNADARIRRGLQAAAGGCYAQHREQRGQPKRTRSHEREQGIMKRSPSFIKPEPASYDEFPESTLDAAGMRVIAADRSRRFCAVHRPVQYALKSGMPLHLHIIEPLQDESENMVFPIIVYVQGSAWFAQDLGLALGQLPALAQRGFVVAILEYRPSPLAPFPAQIKDTKTAIRYIKEHAAAYHADPNRIILWGDSSGGHTAVMTGVTLDDETLDDESPTSDLISLRAVVDYFGPSDISAMNYEPSTMDHIAPDSPEGMVIGGVNVLDHPERVAPTVPMNYLSDDKQIPPILILHGNKDRLVPFGQSVMLYEALREAGKDVTFYQVKGADHGGYPFWTDAVLSIVESFIRDNLADR